MGLGQGGRKRPARFVAKNNSVMTSKAAGSRQAAFAPRALMLEGQEAQGYAVEIDGLHDWIVAAANQTRRSGGARRFSKFSTGTREGRRGSTML